MAETCKTCQLVHVPEVTCVAAQGFTMRALLERIGKPTHCAGCQAEIFFVRHLNGNTAPYTPAGLNHFINCAMRNQLKKPKPLNP